MPLIETESLVLKSYNLAEADRIVVLLTQDHGIVRGVAKGAKRLKSRFGSGLEPFSEVRATYFQKENLELVSLQKVELIRSSFAAASCPEFLHKFSYLADLLVSVLPPHDPSETLYRMVRACIDAAAKSPDNLPAIGVYFELWLLRLAGYLPDWGRCDRCGREFTSAEEANVQANFHLLCSSCRRSESRHVLNGRQRSLVKDVVRLGPAAFAETVIQEPDALAGISRVLRDIISHSIGREVAAEITLPAVAGDSR